MIPYDLPPSGAAISLDEGPRQAITSTSRIWEFRDEYVLGTRLELLVNSSSGALAAESARVARGEIDRLERVFNHRRADSELSALNRSRRAHVSAELFAVVQASETWRAITNGAFDARMGELLQLWATQIVPDPAMLECTLSNLHRSTIRLDAAEREIELHSGADLSLDAIAKGYIVDAALTAARRAVPAIEGFAISIGGDLRCWGVGSDGRGWRVGIPEASTVAMNAPLVDSVELRNAAIATSGRGPRDLIGNRLRSSTISPRTGQPVRDVLSASVVTSHAMDADALATACMVLSPAEGLSIIDRLQGAAARITDAAGQVHTSANWPTLQLAATSPQEHIAQLSTQSSKKKSQSANPQWPDEWVLSIDYTAPPRQSKRSADFRSPYMAMWITDEKNKPVRTILMVGRELDWQRDNFVWFGINRARSKELVELRSLPTSVSGRYPVYWAGMDDNGKPVPVGKYTLHLETSQERGKHNYRNVTLELGRNSFRQELPKLEGSGGIAIFYGHPSERYNAP